MLVKCIKTAPNQLEDSGLRRHVQESCRTDDIGLTPGECYQVFGLMFRSGIPWYLLCAEPQDEYPIPYCSAFFDLVDGAISPGWVLCLHDTNVGKVSLLPGPWAADPGFLERLVDGERDAILSFEQLKILEAQQNKS